MALYACKSQEQIIMRVPILLHYILAYATSYAGDLLEERRSIRCSCLEAADDKPLSNLDKCRADGFKMVILFAYAFQGCTRG
jgi:hypothetical protein